LRQCTRARDESEWESTQGTASKFLPVEFTTEIFFRNCVTLLLAPRPPIQSVARLCCSFIYFSPARGGSETANAKVTGHSF
jgi:hypothetical protein